jgi:hypothetical protein
VHCDLRRSTTRLISGGTLLEASDVRPKPRRSAPQLGGPADSVVAVEQHPEARVVHRCPLAGTSRRTRWCGRGCHLARVSPSGIDCQRVVPRSRVVGATQAHRPSSHLVETAPRCLVCRARRTWGVKCCSRRLARGAAGPSDKLARLRAMPSCAPHRAPYRALRARPWFVRPSHGDPGVRGPAGHASPQGRETSRCAAGALRGSPCLMRARRPSHPLRTSPLVPRDHRGGTLHSRSSRSSLGSRPDAADLVGTLAIACSDLADGFAAPPASRRRLAAHHRAWLAVRENRSRRGGSGTPAPRAHRHREAGAARDRFARMCWSARYCRTEAAAPKEPPARHEHYAAAVARSLTAIGRPALAQADVPPSRL